MKPELLCLGLTAALATSSASAMAYIEIDIKNEVALKNGQFLAKEYGGPGRWALINHSHGRFEGGDIAQAKCTDGYLVSKLPGKFAAIRKVLKPTDFVLTTCEEDNGPGR